MPTLYKEATTSEWVFRRKDLNLYKFNDIYILLTKKGSTEMYKKLAERITHYGVEKECYFALFHTRVIYTKLEEMEGYNEMLDIIRPSNLDYIRQIVNPLEKVVYLDDWTIAQLLGHRSVRNVKYYRKMSNQALADDTREVLKMLSDQMKESLDGWEEEYEQIRQNGGM